MKISKLRIAQIQIDSALDHFFGDKNYVCALTLSGAAEELLGNILRGTGRKHILGDIHEDEDTLSFSKFARMANNVRDELKHSHDNPDPHYSITVTEADAGRMIMRAINNFQRVCHNHSERMEDFYSWVKADQEEILCRWTEA